MSPVMASTSATTAPDALPAGTIRVKIPAAGMIRVEPDAVTISDLTPGDTGAVDVEVTNVSDVAAYVTVTGDHLPSELAGEDDDLLQVAFAGCTQPWAGVPTAHGAAPSAPVCRSGEVPASSGSLAAVPLEAGHTLHLLVTAGLSEAAGNDAQGQRWGAAISVHAQGSEPPSPAPLALTGVDAVSLGVIAVTLILAGAVAAGRHRSPSWKGGSR
ncbi:hypothetical protein [Cellulomonas sp. HD19AZ1]|uniref:hypothetical protein n=1 Tax=Cellulomonas sp. HD19AZ1 TaxID=2559593 RepID=UPI001070AA93|nr:hypothetical protein [Cellulomonas sp. HD19AZ1]TFH68120.1 hypothetical protein E4A51_17910 [Cellulomonas sp. HD19AZ1]